MSEEKAPEAPKKKKRKRELQKRTRYDIYAELLRVDRAKDSIGELCKRGLLEEDDDEGMRVYKVTTRGHQYLELYKRMAGLVGIPIPEPIIGM